MLAGNWANLGSDESLMRTRKRSGISGKGPAETNIGRWHQIETGFMNQAVRTKCSISMIAISSKV